MNLKKCLTFQIVLMSPGIYIFLIGSVHCLFYHSRLSISFAKGFRYFVQQELESFLCFNIGSFWLNDDPIFQSNVCCVMFSVARLSSKVTMSSESISTMVLILLGLFKSGLNIKLFIQLLVSNCIAFPDGVPHQLFFYPPLIPSGTNFDVSQFCLSVVYWISCGACCIFVPCEDLVSMRPAVPGLILWWFLILVFFCTGCYSRWACCQLFYRLDQLQILCLYDFNGISEGFVLHDKFFYCDILLDRCICKVVQVSNHLFSCPCFWSHFWFGY